MNFITKYLYDRRVKRMVQEHGIELTQITQKVNTDGMGETSIFFKGGGGDPIAMLADEAAAILNDADCTNYYEFVMFPHKAKRPVVVTVRWRNGKTPAQKAAEYQAAAEWLLYNANKPERWGGESQAEFDGRLDAWANKMGDIYQLLDIDDN